MRRDPVRPGVTKGPSHNPPFLTAPLADTLESCPKGPQLPGY